MLVDFIMKYRRVVIVCFHLILIVLSSLLAFSLRFDGAIPAEYFSLIGITLPGIVVIRLVVFHFFGVHEGLWRYTSINDLKQIILAVGASSAAIALWIYPVMRLTTYPRSILVLDTLCLIMMMGGVRLGVRLFRERTGFKLQESRRVLIYGAGDAGELLLRDMKTNPRYHYEAVGFLDDDPRKKGLKIHGVPVLGSGKELGSLMDRYAPQEVIIAIPSARPSQVRAIMNTCKPLGIPLKTIPSLKDVISGDVSVHQIRDISLEDLLFRDQVRVDTEHIRDLVCGKRVMITGAAGSIGSELCRQILRHNPRQLLLFDRNENGLYFLDQELGGHYSRDFYKVIVGDIGDTHRLCLKFQKHRPQIVFHAAAYKHVPMMEENIVESVKNNVVGTRNLMELSGEFGVETFVLISTDKAVNPTSVMGTTKRIAEMAVKSMNGSTPTRFMTVRFGNVLGSSGSVVPLFKEQMRKGGPITVTHPDIQRYFMTIPEAVSLVLQSATMGAGGEVFVLDMGEQVKIVDLARTMITLSGLIPEQDIKIEFTGLRPGEKLYEELYGEGELVLDTPHKKIFKAIDARNDLMAPEELMVQLVELEVLAMGGIQEKVLAKMRELVPTYNGAGTPSA
ncbi:MAG: polysaccharide biosynthesis protein [Nitrospirae bacterium]|nr:polysaccharide biosynthesis protein [Nitrospirota bacterium]